MLGKKPNVFLTILQIKEMMANAKSMINERKTQLSAMMPAPPPKPSLVFILERERDLVLDNKAFIMSVNVSKHREIPFQVLITHI